MIRNQNVQDRLYLSQSDEETIYIDNCKVPQHHIEGIRFLYRQFKRKKNGVIINDPFSFGRNIQIILFLKAIRRLLHKPVLILCQEGSEQDWFDRFYTWTDMFDEVVIETTNPMVKKMVIINTMVNLHLFCTREWSIIIVDGDKVISPNPILKLPFKSHFKIWNTAIDMKENLDKFEEIYKWLFPNEIFDKHYFIADHESPVDIIEKSILLDSFLEDIVIRRDDLNSSFEKYQRDVVMSPPKPATTITSIAPTPTSTATSTTISTTAAPTTTNVAPTTTTVAPTNTTVAPSTMSVTISKKNKDATGTKIKRSKTRIDTDIVNKPFESPIAVITKPIKETSKDCEAFDNTEDFSIENYNRKNSKDNGNTKKDKVFEIIEIDNLSSQSDIKLHYESDSETKTVVNKLVEMDTLKLQYEPDSETKTTVDKLEEMDTLVFGHDTFIISKVTDIYKPGKGNNISSNEKEIEPHTILTCKPIDEQTTHQKLFAENKKSSSTSRKLYETSRSSDNERDKKNDRKSLKEKDESDKDHSKINLDELNKEMRDLGTRDNSKKFTHITSVHQSVKCYNEINVKTNEVNDQTSDAGAFNAEQVANSLKRNNIDEQMKECEEKVSKKFKGSFLDSLF